MGAQLFRLITAHPRAWTVVLLLTLARLVLSAQVGLGDDEAYYWDWSRRLDWSYYDHPPMVAWLIASSTAVFGDTPLAVRLPFVLLSVLGGFLVLILTRQLWPRHPERAGRAMIVMHIVPILALGAVFAAPDMPMWVCWVGLILAARQAHRRDLLSDWLTLGGVGGLALLSKYTSGLAIMGVLGWLLSTPRGRRQLRSLRPWLGGCVVLILFSPVLIWNSQREWVSFAFHLSGRHQQQVDVLGQLGTFLGSQALAISPLLLIACLGGLIAPGRCPPKLLSLLRWQAAPVLILFGATSPLTQFKAHWTAPGFLVSAILAIGWLENRRLRGWWWSGVVGLAALLTGLVHLQALHPILPIPARDDPTHDLVGWDDVAGEVERLCSDSDCVAVSHMYQLSAQAAFAMPDRTTLRLGSRVDQYRVWQDGPPRRWRGIWIAHDRYFFDPELTEGPWECSRAGELPIYRTGVEVRRFTFWTCQSDENEGR
jgi:4-amino-4-deoxy-L-arabinose transferase-like glycosyltransferase